MTQSKLPSPPLKAVQSAIQNWGKLTLVYQPSEADIIILVTSRPSEDLMAVYDAHQPVALFSGASWDATVSSPAKLRSSPNLKLQKHKVSLHARAAQVAAPRGTSATSEEI